MANEPDLSEIAEKVGLEVDETLKCDFWPEDENFTVKFVDHKTNSRIRVLFES